MLDALWRTPFWRYSEDEFIAAARGCVAVMGAGGTRITRRVIEALPELCFISKFGIGVDSIDGRWKTKPRVRSPPRSRSHSSDFPVGSYCS